MAFHFGDKDMSFLRSFLPFYNYYNAQYQYIESSKRLKNFCISQMALSRNRTFPEKSYIHLPSERPQVAAY